jgi:hypothetical protein
VVSIDPVDGLSTLSYSHEQPYLQAAYCTVLKWFSPYPCFDQGCYHYRLQIRIIMYTSSMKYALSPIRRTLHVLQFVDNSPQARHHSDQFDVRGFGDMSRYYSSAASGIPSDGIHPQSRSISQLSRLGHNRCLKRLVTSYVSLPFPV